MVVVLVRRLIAGALALCAAAALVACSRPAGRGPAAQPTAGSTTPSPAGAPVPGATAAPDDVWRTVEDFPAPPAEWWDPGYIVSDANFFDATSMTAEQIDDFLDRQVPFCSLWHAKSENPNDSGLPYVCLRYRVWSIPAFDERGENGTMYCQPIAPQSLVSTGVVIATIAAACGISPKTLLVTLEKEMGLVTDFWPWEIQFRSALGYACPDSAPCDPDFYGFVGQIYWAARQFQVYVQRPELFNFQPGTTASILYGPECEQRGDVAIRNAATAALYNYTPYQPSRFVVEGGKGGGPCDAYGNYNFWKVWFDWFGDPAADDPSQARRLPEPTR